MAYERDEEPGPSGKHIIISCSTLGTLLTTTSEDKLSRRREVSKD